MSFWLVFALVLWTFLSVYIGHALTLNTVRDERNAWYDRERQRLADEAGDVVRAAIGEEKTERPPDSGLQED